MAAVIINLVAISSLGSSCHGDNEKYARHVDEFLFLKGGGEVEGVESI
jgi:hypothetical protein